MATYLRLFCTSIQATPARPGDTRFDLKRFSHRAKSIAGIIILIVTPAWLAAGQDVHSPSEFEARNQTGVKKNPPDLNFELRTQDGKNTYHLYETIPLEMVFNSSRPLTYSIELDEIGNWGGQSYRFEVDPLNAVVVYDTHYRTGVICCSSHRVNLSSAPIVMRKELTDFVRFEKAGTYNVFATTERVFRNHRTPRTSQAPGEEMFELSFTLTSNLLTLTILPDDPEWDRERLPQVLRILHDPQAVSEYKRKESATHGTGTYPGMGRVDRDPSQTRWFRALQALSVLDTTEAIRERVAINPLAEFNWPLRIALASTTRPDLMLAALEDRAKDPSVALGSSFEYAWTKFVVQRDCPEVFRRLTGERNSENRRDNYTACRTEAHQKLALFLQFTLSAKTGAAKEITAACVEALKQGSSCPTGMPSAPPAVHKN
jgi:hypothetical protein